MTETPKKVIYNIKVAQKKAQIGDFWVLLHFYYQMFLAKIPKIGEKRPFHLFFRSLLMNFELDFMTLQDVSCFSEPFVKQNVSQLIIEQIFISFFLHFPTKMF